MYILPLIIILSLFNSPKVDTFEDQFYFKSQSSEFSARKRSYGSTVVGGRPVGCPHAYCGCASARYVGLRGSQWNLAANWLRLPRTAPASGMAAARRGHVFILKHHVSGNNWMVYDPNSGGGLTRVHVRSLAGYQIVNPRGSYASNSNYTASKRKYRYRR